MRIEDVTSYKELESFIRLKLSQKTSGVLELELNEDWFFKFIKLIQFSLKDVPKERFANLPVDKSWNRFQLKIEKTFTVVKRK